MIDILLVCNFSTSGPISGLCQTALLVQLVINVVNNYVPGIIITIIIAVCTFIVTLFGYKVVHAYAFWSFGTTVFGFAIGWTSYAAEYTVYHSVNQSKTKVFFSVYLGLILPLLFTQFLGVAIMTAADDENGKYTADHNEAGSGSLIAAVIVGPLGGFGQFCLVLLDLSIITSYCPNIYSLAVTMQVFGEWTGSSLRFIWTLVGTVVYAVVAFPGHSYIEDMLKSFINANGYIMSRPKV
ncbi:hypothetical protein G195_003980 [Phytophthora kernoviae 00238/432]|uniref:Uncharacterized protein n=1 Tax=Phytophthora kernoviae 00238/432 TaxID=1284355 RepID=A0A8J4WIM7_9STRA|nr:hypothetical protein G195_003980 [Phytophthora kernoviae 00238/432]